MHYILYFSRCDAYIFTQCKKETKGVLVMKKIKTTTRFLAVVMALVMVLSCTAMASSSAPAAPELTPDAPVLSLTENNTFAVSKYH